MKKVLLVHGKNSQRIFDISTEELSEKAYQKLFNERYKAGYYKELVEMESQQFKRGRMHFPGAAKKIILYRSSLAYEYEVVEEIIIEK